MSHTKNTSKKGTKGKAAGSKQTKEVKPSAEAAAYAKRAYEAALDHYHKTEGDPAARSLLAVNFDDSDPRALAIAVRVPYWMRQEHTDEEAARVVRDVELLARTLEDKECSAEFARAFGAVYTDHLLDGCGVDYTTPEVLRVLLPLVVFTQYREGRPADADTALSILLTLRETLNKDEVAERARAAVYRKTVAGKK
jgi:hypothetical protein